VELCEFHDLDQFDAFMKRHSVTVAPPRVYATQILAARDNLRFKQASP